MTKVGVYAPTYNVAKYVGAMIDSINKQTFVDWKLAIIDDGSTDGSYEVALKAADDDSRIIVERRESHDGRIGRIKNETIKLLGDVDYLVSVDSDDLIPKDTLKIFSEFLDNNPDVGALCGNFICFNDEGKRWVFPHVANSGGFDSDILLRYMCYFPLRFYRKKFYDKIGGYDNELTSAIDYDMALKLDEVTTIKRIKEPISYYYRQHDIQVSTRARPEQDSNARKALEAAIERRGLNCKVIGDRPPFRLEEIRESAHFIWGK